MQALSEAAFLQPRDLALRFSESTAKALSFLKASARKEAPRSEIRFEIKFT